MAIRKRTRSSKTGVKRDKILRSNTKPGVTMHLSVSDRSRQTASFRRAVEHSIAATKKNGNPVARYDVQRRQAYLEYPDGTKAYVE